MSHCNHRVLSLQPAAAALLGACATVEQTAHMCAVEVNCYSADLRRTVIETSFRDKPKHDVYYAFRGMDRASSRPSFRI